MIDPAALRAIADELEAAQRAAATVAIERLTELVNGSLPNEQGPPIGVLGETDSGASDQAALSDQVPEAPPVAKPAAVGLPPGVASGTDKRSVKQRLEDREKVPCPHCAARMLPKGLPIHLAKRHGIKAASSRPDPLETPQPLRAHDGLAGAKRRYLCSRCNEPFDTPEARDLHEGWHTPGEQRTPLGERDPVPTGRGGA